MWLSEIAYGQIWNKMHWFDHLKILLCWHLMTNIICPGSNSKNQIPQPYKLASLLQNTAKVDCLKDKAIYCSCQDSHCILHLQITMAYDIVLIYLSPKFSGVVWLYKYMKGVECMLPTGWLIHKKRKQIKTPYIYPLKDLIFCSRFSYYKFMDSIWFWS